MALRWQQEEVTPRGARGEQGGALLALTMMSLCPSPGQVLGLLSPTAGGHPEHSDFIFLL